MKKYLSILLAVVLAVTLIPPLNHTGAAPNLEILSWATAPDDGSGNPDWDTPADNPFSEPSRTTQNRIDIEVDFTEIASEDIPSLYYVVHNVNSDVIREVKDSPAVQTGTQRVVFEDVELTEGLNKITVILDSPSQPRSLPAWITFTEVANISNLRINDEMFTNGIFVPEENPIPQQNSVFIDGMAPNTTEVRGYTFGDNEGSLANFFYPETGDFSFSAGEDNVDLTLRPGDNEVVIIASNPFKSYRAEREFVYNNGLPFLFNTQITDGENLEEDSYEDQMLFKQPTLEASDSSGNYSITFTTDIKINKQEGTISHNRVNFNVNGDEKYFVEFIEAAGNFQINNNGTTSAITPLEEEDYYIFRNVTISELEVDTSQANQVLDVVFDPISGTETEVQNFVYYFVNENNPYIDEVFLRDSGTRMYSGVEINITTTAIEFLVDGKQGTEAVNVYTNHQNNVINPDPFDEIDPDTGHIIVRLDKDDLPEGQSLLRFVPLKNDIEFSVGAREYLVNYNPSPYVYLTNVHNGKIFTTLDGQPSWVDSDGDVRDGPALQIKPVNIPREQWGDIRVRWNDHYDRIQPEDIWPEADSYEEADDFEEFRFFFGDQGPDSREDWELNNGQNNLIIEIYPQGTLNEDGDPRAGVNPITTFKYELFYFEDNVPEVHSLDLERDFLRDYDFVQVDGHEYRYYTQENAMKFEMSFRNASQIEVIVNTFDEDGDAQQTRSVYEWNGSSMVYRSAQSDLNILTSRSIDSSSSTNSLASGSAISRNIELFGTGTNSVEITVTNPGGLFNTRILEVVREPANYVVHYPHVDPITKTGTINGNFTRMYVEAEGADRITYDRDEEVTRKETVRINGVDREVFVFELQDLRSGNNKVNFTVVRGTREDDAEITLVNTDTPVVGAQHKESISSNRIRAFDRQLELRFPRDTVLKVNDPTAPNQSLSPSRDILLGIADPVDGRVNKTLHPLRGEDTVPEFSRKSSWERGYLYLSEPTGRFRQASNMFWIDAGMVPSDQDQNENLFGSGHYPYERGYEFYTKTANDYPDLYVPSEPGELTLSYDPNIVESAWRYVTVYHYGYNEDHLGNERFEWKNIGGVVDQRRNTITVPIQEFGYYVVMYMDRSYDDIIGHPWARNDLDTLYSKGIMQPMEPNRFETNVPITRGEFATLLVKAFDIPLDYEGTGTFSDVRRVDPYSFGLYEYKYIETAARKGIIRGSLGGRFLPRENITREDAAVMISRAANLREESNEDRARQRLEREFTDVANFGTYAIAPVLAVTRAGLMSGKPNVVGEDERRPTYYFDPEANLTRAEAARTMMNVLLSEKKIPNL